MTFDEWHLKVLGSDDRKTPGLLSIAETAWDYQDAKLDIAIEALEIIKNSYPEDEDCYFLAKEALEKMK